ncbi:MAG: hypothetical protein SNJ60_01705 [Pseudanabaenaceae cyanobacterium]
MGVTLNYSPILGRSPFPEAPTKNLATQRQRGKSWQKRAYSSP